MPSLRARSCGSCGPRGFYGTTDVHLGLERALADFHGADEGIIYSDTLSTVSSVIPAFSKRGDLVVYDAGVSEALLVGIELSRSKALSFKHNDVAGALRVLDSALGQKVQVKIRVFL